MKRFALFNQREKKDMTAELSAIFHVHALFLSFSMSFLVFMPECRHCPFKKIKKVILK